MSSKEPVVSLSGSPIYRHGEEKAWEAPQGEECIEQISAHIATHLGEVETVFHELMSDTVHIDVHFVKPTPEFPYARLVTSGMSDLPMVVPEGAGLPRYLELMMTLPGDWKMAQEDFKDERWYWPVRQLKVLARMPHKFDTWLGWGHTIPNGDPAEPYAGNTRLCCSILLPSITVPEEFNTLEIHPDKVIHFLAVVPLYQEEMALKLRNGANKLLDKLGAADVSDIVDLTRGNVARKRFGIF